MNGHDDNLQYVIFFRSLRLPCTHWHMVIMFFVRHPLLDESLVYTVAIQYPSTLRCINLNTNQTLTFYLVRVSDLASIIIK
jgi:hypothetical protein